MNGDPYALWVHVRAVDQRKHHPVEHAVRLQHRLAERRRTQEPAPTGLIRWTPVEGATSYQVWFVNARPSCVPLHDADQRRRRARVLDVHPKDAGTIRWRVRAVRYVALDSLPYGIAVRRVRALVAGLHDDDPQPPTSRWPRLRRRDIVSDIHSSRPHAADARLRVDRLRRTRSATPATCSSGASTSSPTRSASTRSWSARSSARRRGRRVRRRRLRLPARSRIVDRRHGRERSSRPGRRRRRFAADGGGPSPSETSTVAAARRPQPTPAAPGGPGSRHRPRHLRPPPTPGTANGDRAAGQRLAQGRYWWTVVPVAVVDILLRRRFAEQPGDAVEYHDAELPQDVCATGRVWSFGLAERPVTTVGAGPYVSGSPRAGASSGAAAAEPTFQRAAADRLEAGDRRADATRSSCRGTSIRGWRRRIMTSVVTSAVLPLDGQGHGHLVLPRARGQPEPARTGAEDDVVVSRSGSASSATVRRRQVASSAS